MNFPPPPRFTEAKRVSWSQLVAEPPYFAEARAKRTGRKLKGIKYEASVQEYLEARYPNYIPSPWIKFESQGSVKWCQPDGLLFFLEEGIIVLIEIKHTHTPAAWFQMRKLYIPTLEVIFPPHLWEFRTLEIVKWYDASMLFPEPLKMLAKPEDARTLSTNTTGLHIWKP